jgi:hypothetical protein
LGILFVTGDRMQILTQRLSATKPERLPSPLMKSPSQLPHRIVRAEPDMKTVGQHSVEINT